MKPLEITPTERVNRLFSQFEKLPDDKLRDLLNEIFDHSLDSLSREGKLQILMINLIEMESNKTLVDYEKTLMALATQE